MSMNWLAGLYDEGVVVLHGAQALDEGGLGG